jgi:hypothetical protein
MFRSPSIVHSSKAMSISTSLCWVKNVCDIWGGNSPSTLLKLVVCIQSEAEWDFLGRLCKYLFLILYLQYTVRGISDPKNYVPKNAHYLFLLLISFDKNPTRSSASIIIFRSWIHSDSELGQKFICYATIYALFMSESTVRLSGGVEHFLRIFCDKVRAEQ